MASAGAGRVTNAASDEPATLTLDTDIMRVPAASRSAAGTDVSAAGADVNAAEIGLSAAGIDVSAAGAGLSAAVADVSAAGGNESADGPSLDQLPVELLLEVASWLDLPSILRLEQVSRRYRDAGPRLRQQLRVLRVGEHADGSTAFTELPEPLPQLLELRELHVGVLYSLLQWARRPWEHLVAASRRWQKLETLRVDNIRRIGDTTMLIQLCENCSRLTDVTLNGDLSDTPLERIVAALPAVRAFRVRKPGISSMLSGSFLSRLPAELRHLSVECWTLDSEAVTELRRYGELRSLTLRCLSGIVEPAHLAAGLSGCGRLRRLTLTAALRAITAQRECLLHLPELRHLDLIDSRLADVVLDWLLSALPPSLESLSLRDCRGLTSEGLAMGLRKLSSLPSLRSLELTGTAGVCDRALAELRSQSLQQLYLIHQTLRRLQNRGTFTAAGLLGVVHSCGSLQTLVLFVASREKRVDCSSGAREEGLIERIRAAIREKS